MIKNSRTRAGKIAARQPASRTKLLVIAGLAAAFGVVVAVYPRASVGPSGAATATLATPSPVAALVGDVNNSGLVDVADLSLLLAKWGSTDAASDLNRDGAVDVFDLSDLLVNWGKTATVLPSYTYKTLQNPSRTMAYDAAGKLIGTFTQGSRTVVLAGAQRTFAEPANTSATVTGTSWVRLYPAAFSGQVDENWLTTALADISPDIFQISMQYIQGAPALNSSSGSRIAGDADYGPLQADGTRQEGADFNDYLGLQWTYGTSIDIPEAGQFGSLDCSGYQRMVWGYRAGLPLSLDTDGGASIPRRTFQIYDSAPGVIVKANAGTQIMDFSIMQPGDIVFFDADTSDGTQIDHMGTYLGVDSAGNHRFISSRKQVNGPTLGDAGGSSRLDGPGLYALSFRAVRRF